MYTLVNDPYITRLFLYALAKKREDRPEVIATELGTRSGHAFLENYILKAQLDKTYQTTQKIISLLGDLLEEVHLLEETSEEGFKRESLCSHGFWNFKATPSFLTHIFDDRYKTSSGFFIYCDPIIMFIFHPFGWTLVRPFSSCMAHEILNVAEFNEAFINRVQATFQGFCTYETLTSGELNLGKLPLERASNIIEILRPAACGDRIRKFDIEDIQEVSREDLPRKKGSRHIIMSSQSNIFSVYKIGTSFESSPPRSQFENSDQEHYSSKLMRRVLTILEKRFGKISNS